MYTPLFIHSSYSLLSSAIRIDQLVDYAKQLGLAAIGLTDYHNLFGAFEFSMACTKKGIKPIIGSQIRMEGGHEILLYCKNKIGYENLSYLISESYINLTDDLPHIKWDELRHRSDGLICVAPPGILKADNMQELRQCADELQKTLEWYVGVEPHGHNFQKSAYMSQVHDTPVVAVGETYFLKPEEQEAHDVLLCIKNQRHLLDENRPRSDSRFCFIKPDDIQSAYPNLDFAVQNTNVIADRCDFILKPASPKLPRFENNAEEECKELRKIAQNGLNKMAIEDSSIYQERLDFELQVIEQMGFAGYFLIVSDFVTFARKQQIPVSIRGSGAGSLVARCIDITEIDPIRFELFFERFLNPGRVSMPDFDIDFSPKGREKTIEYVVSKYGSECVSGIITFGSLSSRSVLKDVGRVMHVPYLKLDDLSKRIQVLFGRPFTLEETYQMNQEFAQIIDDDEMLRRVFDIGKQLEGLYRHVSAHAAGMIITDEPIYKTAPLYQDRNSNLPLVQFSMKYAELAGLIKFDFLGVTALDVLADTIALIKTTQPEFELSTIPLDDKETYQFLRGGHTRGVFQFETPGMTKLIRDMGADCIEDLIATVSLYRPGPMDNIPLFISCKQGKEKVQYIYPGLEQILSNTYGIIVYQEQILRIVQDIAGYSLSEADLLRRAIGKKISEEMAKHKTDFIQRAHEIQGGDIAKAEELFKLIETFANYGFNKAHAVAYAIVGYRGAYLKTHFPLYFVCVSMTAEQHNTEKLVELVLEAQSMGIKTVKPCINRSDLKFTIEDGKIVYSLAAIRSIGEHLAKQIIDARPFSDIRDFMDRLNLNKREVDAIIKSGALDIFGENRGILLQTAMILLDKTSNLLFDPSLFVDDKHKWTKEDELKYQKEVLGFYLDDHPLNQYSPEKLGVSFGSRLDVDENRDSIPVIGLLETYISKIGKRNNKYYIATFSDIYGSWQAMVVDDNLLETLPTYKGVAVWCTVQVRNGRIMLRQVISIDSKLNSINNIRIKVTTKHELHKLSTIFQQYKSPEGTGVYVHTDDVLFIGCVSNTVEFLKSIQEFKWKMG